MSRLLALCVALSTVRRRHCVWVSSLLCTLVFFCVFGALKGASIPRTRCWRAFTKAAKDKSLPTAQDRVNFSRRENVGPREGGYVRVEEEVLRVEQGGLGGVQSV